MNTLISCYSKTKIIQKVSQQITEFKKEGIKERKKQEKLKYL